MKNPCKRNCPNRSPTCHAECEDYLAFNEWCIKQRKERMKYSDANSYVTDAVAKSERKRRGKQ